MTRKQYATRNKTCKTKHKIRSVYWINLDRSIERKKQMLEVFQDPIFHCMKTHRVTAFDGKDPAFLSYLKNVENKSSKYTLPEYACTLSHVKAIEEFEKSGNEMTMIFEDDISLEFKPIWKIDLETCVRNAPKDWEIIQLYYFLNREHLPSQLYTENKTKKNSFYSTLAYIINRKGAKRFLNEFIPKEYIRFDATIRHTADEYLYHKMKTYVYKYPFFTPTSKDSTIHPKDLKSHRSNHKMMVRLLH